MKRCVVCFVLLVGVMAASGQVITPETKATPDQLQQWLASGDPRLVAWAATLAREQNDEHALWTMAVMAEKWKEPEDRRHFSTEEGLRKLAMDAVLDGLIERRMPVSVEALRAVRPSFQTQALVLASQMPVSEAAPVLMDWYREPASGMAIEPAWAVQVGRRLSWTGHVAGMMLSREPPPGFAAMVVEESVERLEFDVEDTIGLGSAGGFGGSCGGMGAVKLPEGWPEVFAYNIRSDRNGEALPLLVAAGGEQRYLQRYRTPQWSPDGCASMESSVESAQVRRRLLAEMVGVVQGEELPWKVENVVEVRWVDGAALQSKVREIVSGEERKLDATVAALAGRGYLTEDEAKRVRTKLIVVVHDIRQNRTPALPRIVMGGPHVELRDK